MSRINNFQESFIKSYQTHTTPQKLSQPHNNTNNKTKQTKDQKKEKDQSKITHPYDDVNYYNNHPPIPMFNYIIDNCTLNIIEDKTGQP